MTLSLALRKAYYNALNGNVTHQGQPVKIYEGFAPETADSAPYIILVDQSEVQGEVKRSFIYTAFILVDIVTQSTDPAGSEAAELIAGQVEDLIQPADFTDIDASAYGYKIVDTIKENGLNRATKNATYYIYRKLLRYRHLITKS